MHWYTRRSDGAEKGPFDEETLRGALARGELARTTLVRREDEQDWAPIGKGERLSSEPPNAAVLPPGEQPAVPGQHATRKRLPEVLEDGRASPGLKALAWGMFLLYAAHSVLNRLSSQVAAPRSMEAAVTSAELAGFVLGLLLITWVISWVIGVFRSSKSERTKIQTFLIG